MTKKRKYTGPKLGDILADILEDTVQELRKPTVEELKDKLRHLEQEIVRVKKHIQFLEKLRNED